MSATQPTECDLDSLVPDVPTLDPLQIVATGLVSKSLLYRDIANGQIAHLRFGKRIRIPRPAVLAYLKARFRPAVPVVS